MARLSISIDDEDLRQLTAISEQSGMSIAALIRNAVSSGLSNPPLLLPLTPNKIRQIVEQHQAVEAAR